MSAKKYYNILAALCSILFFCACNDVSISPDKNSYGYDFYPLDSNNQLIYEVTEISIDAPLDSYDTLCYQLKEIVAAILDTGLTDTSYLIHRYYRTSDTLPWEMKDVWSLRLSENELVKNEENIQYLRLRFPLYETAEWNGNAYNTLDDEVYEVTNIDTTFSTENIELDSVLYVIQADDETLIDKTYAYEMYAKNVGLVKKYRMEIESQTTLDSGYIAPIENRITQGTIYEQVLISY